MSAKAEAAHDTRPFQVTHRLVLSIAVPMTLGFLTTPLLGLTDTAVVGRLGQPEALAGLAIGAIIFDLLYGSLSFFRTSTTGLAAQAFGRNDPRELQAVFWRALLSAIGLGLLMLLLAPVILAVGPDLMTSDADVADVVRSYFGIRVLSSPATFVNFAVLGLIFGRGRAMLGLPCRSCSTARTSLSRSISAWASAGGLPASPGARSARNTSPQSSGLSS